MKTMTTAVIILAMATPTAAQKAPPAPPPPPAALFPVQPIPPTDLVRLAAARPVIDRVWPVGSYARLIHIVMGPVMQDTVARSFNMKLGDLVPGIEGKDAKTSDKASETLGQMAAKDDPYIQQRVTLTLNAVGDELAKLMTDAEPGVRDALAHAYARRFTVAQLGELDRFFATPTGQAYAADQLTLMMTPDMTKAMQAFLPNVVKAAPDMIAHITAATKDLPKTGTPKSNSVTPVLPPVVVPPPPAKTP